MPPPDFPLILLRHGLTKMPAERCFGQTDVPLSDEGQEQIHALAKNWPYPRPSRIYSSDLSRAVTTAEILAKIWALPITQNPRLREIDFGEWEGREWADIHRTEPVLMDEWGRDWINTAPPGGENVVQLCRRVRLSFEDICRTPHQPTLIIAHTGSLRALMCHLDDEPPERLFEYQFAHGTPRVLLHDDIA